MPMRSSRRRRKCFWIRARSAKYHCGDSLVRPGDGPVAVAIHGGHGELFVQRFARDPLAPLSASDSLRPESAAIAVPEPLVVGSGAPALVPARGSGEAIDMLPSALHALRLPETLRNLDPKPAYGRAPDARPKAA